MAVSLVIKHLFLARIYMAQLNTQSPENSSINSGIIFMLFAMAMFASNDALGKWLVATYPVGQLIALRSLAALIILIPLAWHRGELRRIRYLERPGLQILRVGLVAAEVGCFYWAARYLPLADVFMFYLASPLFLTALSVPLLGEKVGPRRWAAVIIGFMGVILIFPPTEAALSPPALIALLGSLILALMLILTRYLRGTGGLSLITFQTTGVAIAGSVTLPFAWVTPTYTDFMLLGVLGFVATTAHYLMNKALSLSPSSVVAPFQYTLIIWGLFYGYIIWNDLPRPIALFGAALIIASGLIVLYLERQKRSLT